MTASYDGTARVWRPFAPRLKPVVLSGHKGEVVDAEFSPDGTRVVTASFDGTARLWNPRTGKELTIPLAHGDAVPSATFSPDGARVVTASADQTGADLGCPTGTELAVLRGHDNYVGGAEFSPDGNAGRHVELRPHGARLGRDRLRAALHGGRPSIPRSERCPEPNPRPARGRVGGRPSSRSETRDRRRDLSLAAGGDRVVNAVFSADGRDIVTWDAKGGVRVWDPATGRLRRSMSPGGKARRRRPDPGRGARCLL